MIARTAGSGAGGKTIMRVDERDEGDYRIYAQAVPEPRRRGYIAGVVVKRLRGAQDTPREEYRNESLASGFSWSTPECALLYAVTTAQQVIRVEQNRLAG
jgi:hypothetical protein